MMVQDRSYLRLNELIMSKARGASYVDTTIHSGGSIGLHKHPTSDDINYVISGTGKAVCNGQEEILNAGTCHICKKGSEHSISNTGSEDLVLLTFVVER